MNKLSLGGLLLYFLVVASSPIAAEPSLNYDALVQQGKTKLQAGSAEQALSSGLSAIKTNTVRWEGYALAGGALMNLKRYEEAADTLSKAIERAPEPKQPALRDLRRQCLLAEAGAPAVASITPPTAATTQAEIVLWKSIENSIDPSDFSTYLNQYPNGVFVALAERHLADLRERVADRARFVQQNQAQKVSQAGWTDSAGLMWARPVDYPDVGINSLDYDAARTFCARLNIADLSDWRLPSVEELQAVYHPGPVNGEILIDGPLANDINTRFATKQIFLWTSTPGQNPGEHMWVFHGSAKSHSDHKSAFGLGGGGNALCVRTAKGDLGYLDRDRLSQRFAWYKSAS